MLLNLLGDSDLNPISGSSGNRRHIIPFPTSFLYRHCSPGSTQARSVPCQVYHLGAIYFTYFTLLICTSEPAGGH